MKSYAGAIDQPPRRASSSMVPTGSFSAPSKIPPRAAPRTSALNGRASNERMSKAFMPPNTEFWPAPSNGSADRSPQLVTTRPHHVLFPVRAGHGDDVRALRYGLCLSGTRPDIIDPAVPFGAVGGGDEEVAGVFAGGIDDLARAAADHGRLRGMAERLLVGAEDKDVPVAVEPGGRGEGRARRPVLRHQRRGAVDVGHHLVARRRARCVRFAEVAREPFDVAPLDVRAVHRVVG